MNNTSGQTRVRATVREYTAFHGYLKPWVTTIYTIGRVPAIGIVNGRAHFGALFSPTEFRTRDGYRLFIIPRPLLLGYTGWPLTHNWTITGRRRVPYPVDRVLVLESDYQKLLRALSRKDREAKHA